MSRSRRSRSSSRSRSRTSRSPMLRRERYQICDRRNGFTAWTRQKMETATLLAGTLNKILKDPEHAGLDQQYTNICTLQAMSVENFEVPKQYTTILNAAQEQFKTIKPEYIDFSFDGTELQTVHHVRSLSDAVQKVRQQLTLLRPRATTV